MTSYFSNEVDYAFIPECPSGGIVDWNSRRWLAQPSRQEPAFRSGRTELFSGYPAGGHRWMDHKSQPAIVAQYTVWLLLFCLMLAPTFPWIDNWPYGDWTLKASCLPYAVGKQPYIPLTNLVRKKTLKWWWCWLHLQGGLLLQILLSNRSPRAQ